MKLTRFLIADNPMVEGSPSAIIHTIEPQAIIEVIEGHQQCSSPFRHYSFVNIDGVPEYYTFRVHHLMTQEFDSEKHHLIVTKLLDRAWHWYKAYMNWEDKQID
jgi:hypothetical protein